MGIAIGSTNVISKTHMIFRIAVHLRPQDEDREPEPLAREVSVPGPPSRDGMPPSPERQPAMQNRRAKALVR